MMHASARHLDVGHTFPVCPRCAPNRISKSVVHLTTVEPAATESVSDKSITSHQHQVNTTACAKEYVAPCALRLPLLMSWMRNEPGESRRKRCE